MQCNVITKWLIPSLYYIFIPLLLYKINVIIDFIKIDGQ